MRCFSTISVRDDISQSIRKTPSSAPLAPMRHPKLPHVDGSALTDIAFIDAAAENVVMSAPTSTSISGFAKGRPASAARAHISHSGFTLIELLVVTCIMGVLLALVLPLAGMIRRSARSVQCMNNQRHMHVALITFAGEHKDRLPSSGCPGWTTSVRLTTGETAGSSHLVDQGYLPSARVFVCPQSDSLRGMLRDTFRNVMGIDWAYHYAANLGYVGTDRDPNDEVMGRYWWTGTHTARVRTSAANAAKTVLTCDRVMFVSYTDTFQRAGQLQLSATAVHQGASIASYVDGHASALRVNDARTSWIGIDEGGIPSYADWMGVVEAGE